MAAISKAHTNGNEARASVMPTDLRRRPEGKGGGG